MTPVVSDRQTLLESHLAVRPPATLLRYVDYWSTTVHAFDVHEPHDHLVVTGSSVVETAPAEPVETDTGWEAVRRPEVQDRFAELLLPSAYAPADDALSELARAAGALASPAAATTAIGEQVRSSLRYEPGTTHVATSATEAWSQGSGVCQDFAHVALALLRAAGIPARYISGYLHPSPEASVGETVSGASHAWVEAWIGRWLPFDPTNDEPVGERHVTVARGRDYADVAPLRGLYHGGALDRLEVTVELTRLR